MAAVSPALLGLNGVAILTATLDYNGTKIKLYYMDTGQINSTNYTTWVVYHGTAFTSCELLALVVLIRMGDRWGYRHVQQIIASRPSQ